ncbi:hypothetical protein F4824DRAFT_301267 [Ustulina deusta]|nr:hypothetical protein F4824DRAFT_301267 [Ustulina deusta]
MSSINPRKVSAERTTLARLHGPSHPIDNSVNQAPRLVIRHYLISGHHRRSYVALETNRGKIIDQARDGRGGFFGPPVPTWAPKAQTAWYTTSGSGAWLETEPAARAVDFKKDVFFFRNYQLSQCGHLRFLPRGSSVDTTELDIPNDSWVQRIEKMALYVGREELLSLCDLTVISKLQGLKKSSWFLRRFRKS